jgi:hypothetical protein
VSAFALAEPAHPPSRKAPLAWAVAAAIPWTVLVVAQVVWFALDSDVADRVAAQLTDIASIGEQDAT